MDLRPGYHEYAPPAAVRDSLACLWVRVVGAGDRSPLHVLPDACVDLIWQAGRGLFVAGPDTGPVPSPLAPGTVMVGARFLPGAGGPALGVPLSEIQNQRVDVADLLPRLGDQLLEAADALPRVAALAARLVAAGPPDRAVRGAARLLADPHASVETVADDVGLSERQLRRRFRDAVGYGPRTLQRVLRFQRFLARLDAGGARPDLAGIAADTGYADQAHLTRECTRLAGLPPGALARARHGGDPLPAAGEPASRLLRAG